MTIEEPLSAEDNKLVVLARATRARTGAAEGAALRDLDGRTYAAATVELPSLRISAVGVCVAMAVASGARGAEAVVVLGEERQVPPADPGAVGDAAGDGGDADLDIVRDFAGPGVPVLVGTAAGRLTDRRTS